MFDGFRTLLASNFLSDNITYAEAPVVDLYDTLQRLSHFSEHSNANRFQSDDKLIDKIMKQIVLILYFLSSPDTFFPYHTFAVMDVLMKKFPLLCSLKMELRESQSIPDLKLPYAC